MRILYFGTVCDLNEYEKKLSDCGTKPSIATIVFESSLLSGFRENGAQVDVYSYPMIPPFPRSKWLGWGAKREMLPCGYQCTWLKTLNVPIFKQLSRRLDCRRVLKKWLKENAGEGLVFTYSIPPFLVKDILKYTRAAGVKAVAIVPDLLRDMYINEKPGLLTKLKNCYLAPALALQGEYDGYVYLTEAMADVVAPEKPYMVMEGIADISTAMLPVPKAAPRAIMYAGMLHEKFGILNLLDAFETLEADAQLWLFGDGTAVPEIQRRARSNPRIQYFGMVPRQQILERERAAAVLVNPRSPGEEFTQYSFPSKTIEYMLSGTPLVTTRLPGIPAAYFDYVFPAESDSPQALAAALNTALSMSDAQLDAFGCRARQFIIESKNSRSQSARILKFMEEVKYGQNR